MKHYVTSDCMCSINVAFNIKAGENFFIFCRILSFETLKLSLFYLNFLRCVIVRAIHTKIAFAVLMANRTRAMFIMQLVPLF